MFMFINKTPA